MKSSAGHWVMRQPFLCFASFGSSNIRWGLPTERHRETCACICWWGGCLKPYRVFNMGVGMVWFVPEAEADRAVGLIKSKGFTACRIGEVVAGSGVTVK